MEAVELILLDVPFLRQHREHRQIGTSGWRIDTEAVKRLDSGNALR
jgi:hypothetical protein